MPDRGRDLRRLPLEIWIVLGLSLGRSGVYAVVNLIAAATSAQGIRGTTASLNGSRSDREYFDLTLQLLVIGFALVPVLLALYLMSLDRVEASPLRRLGIDRARPRQDVMYGLGLAALIGIPGLVLYFAGRGLGITVEVITAPDVTYWWTVPVLVLAALQNAILEEVVVVGYLMTRLKQLGWSTAATIVTAAALRGSYHLYQGIGAGIGNFAMGLVFGYLFHRTGRVLPLIIAHAVLDIFAFVGYLAFADTFGLR